MGQLAVLLSESAEPWHLFAQNLRDRINRFLWDEEDGLYYDWDFERKERHKVASVASFLPMFAGACSSAQAARLKAHLTDPDTFGTALPLPSIAKSDPLYGSDMWRGPVWINFSYLISLGLRRYGFAAEADSLVRKTVLEISRWYHTDGVLYEMYDPEGRQSPRSLLRKGPVIEPYAPSVRYQTIRDYGWTASLCAAMIAENPLLFRRT